MPALYVEGHVPAVLDALVQALDEAGMSGREVEALRVAASRAHRSNLQNVYVSVDGVAEQPVVGLPLDGKDEEE